MNRNRRIAVRLIAVILLIAGAWFAFATFVGPPLVEQAYRGESLPVLNDMLSGRAHHPLEHYHGRWDTLRRGLLQLLLVGGALTIPLLLLRDESDGDDRAARERGPFLVNSLLAVAAAAAVLWTFFRTPAWYVQMVTEDRWTEYGTFVAFGMTFVFVAVGMAAHCSLRRPAFALLGAGSLFVAMEEISWGQRIIGFGTPGFLRAGNHQGEATLHNLALLGPWIMWTVTGALILWCVIGWWIARAAPRLDRWRRWLGAPLIPVRLWPFFIVSGLFAAEPMLQGSEWWELWLGVSLALVALHTLASVPPGTSAPAPADSPGWWRPPPALAALALAAPLAAVTAGLVHEHSWPEDLVWRMNDYAAVKFPQAGMDDQARMVFDYIDRHPRFVIERTRIDHGRLLMRLGKREEAVGVLTGALAGLLSLAAERPGDPLPPRRVGEVLTLLERHEEADEAFEEAIERDQTRLAEADDAAAIAATHRSIGETLLTRGDTGSAIEHFLQARAHMDEGHLVAWIDRLIEQARRRQQDQRSLTAQAE